jgi:translocation and assembly module TamA
MFRICRAVLGSLAVCFVVLAFCLPHTLSAQEEETLEAGDNATDVDGASVDSAPYKVSINVPDVDGVKGLIMDSSQLLRLQDSPPPSRNALLRRAESDVGIFAAVMRSKGYYDPDIRLEVSEDGPPYQVDVSIALGPQYTLEAYDIVFQGGTPEAPLGLPTIEDSGLTLGEPALADRIAAAQSTLLRWLNNRGYPYAEVTDRLVLASHPDRTIWVQLTLKAGPLIRFGTLDIKGLINVDPELVERNVTWGPGDIYDQSKVDGMRNRLLNANVFERVSIRAEGTAEDEPGERTIQASFTEAPARTIGVGLSYSTDLGPEVRFSWEHRNVFGEAEAFATRMNLGLERQRLSNSFRKPDFLSLDQNLIVEVDLLSEKLEAFDQTGSEGAVRLEWPVNENLRGTWGVAYDFLEIVESGDTKQSILFGLPVGYSWDNTDNLFDPASGFRMSARVTPWTGTFDKPVTFVTNDVSASTYFSFDADDRAVLALRANFGTSMGEELERIPSNRRFYAGGGGSIRGYEYQKVGPLDANNEPLGGRSLLTVGAEFRIKVTEDIGVVPFYEGGNVYSERFPDLSEPMFWAAGIGLRYYTPVGPIRFDVAIPLDRRKNIDDPFQLYISLGQAF